MGVALFLFVFFECMIEGDSTILLQFLGINVDSVKFNWNGPIALEHISYLWYNAYLIIHSIILG